MRKWTFVVCLAVWGAGMAMTSAALAEATSQPTSQPTSLPTTAQAASEADVIQATAEKRAAGVLEALDLADPAKQAQVCQVMQNFYLKRIAWESNDDRIKELERQLAKVAGDSDEAKQIQTELAALREELAKMREAMLAELGKILSAEQIETVKDNMTYGRARLIYNDCIAKHVLGDPQKAFVRKLLADAREEALMAGSAADKHRLFDQAAGKANLYVDALEKLEQVAAAIQARRFDQADQTLAQIERHAWLKEVLAKDLTSARRDLAITKTTPPPPPIVTTAPVVEPPAP